MYGRRKQIGGYLGEGRRAGVRGRDVKGAGGISRGMERFPILIEVMLCQCVYTSQFIKAHTLDIGS